nr:MAG TPA: hypothetical protein [Caudoviricetes sp.]
MKINLGVSTKLIFPLIPIVCIFGTLYSNGGKK